MYAFEPYSSQSYQIQEAGLSFYSYVILIRVLHGRDRRTFMTLFWTLIATISVFRCVICASRLQDILQNSSNKVDLIDHMHVGYFTSIALVEMLSSYFLLRRLFSAQSSSVQLNSNIDLFKWLTRSTEIRLAVLTLIGITRAITYSFQTTAQSATSTSGQVDRFVATLECLFPMIMLQVTSLSVSVVMQG
jgi:cbb3-type cytochrome oxidase subunit 1